MLNSLLIGEKESHKKNETIHGLVLISLLAATTYFSPEISSIYIVAVIVVYCFLFGASVDRGMKGLVVTISLIGLPGLIFLINNDSYDILKDVWYLAKIIGCLLSGYYVGRAIQDFEKFIRNFILLCIFLSLEYVVRYFSKGSTVDLQSAYDSGGIPLICAVGAVITLRGKGVFLYSNSIFTRTCIFAFILISFSITFSRTSIGSIIILIMVSFGIFENIKRIAISTIIFSIFLIFSWTLLPEYDSQDVGFLGKLGNSFNEISFIDEGSPEEMVKNWRGFEAYNAQLAFDSASILEQIFGRGFGSTVDLGLYIGMGEGMFFRYLPILHNGYYHVIGKYGLIGLIFYLIFLAKVIKARSFSSQAISEEGVFILRMFVGIGCVLAYTTLVISGIFNKSSLDSMLIFVGGIYGWNAGIKISYSERVINI